MAWEKEDKSTEQIAWLDSSFVEDVLSRKNGLPVYVKELQIERAVGRGENYASLLLRVSVDYSFEKEKIKDRKKTSLIVKCMPTSEVMRKFLRESGAFDREIKMYSSTLPALEGLLNEAFLKEVSFAPRFLRCRREDTLVLKDLRDVGFRMCNRHKGMDLEHSSMVLRNLARFHAASVALHADKPSDVESYTDIFYIPEKRDQIDRFVPQTLECVAKAVDTWVDPQFAGYAGKLRTFAKTAVDQVMLATRPAPKFLNVLNHGDCWVNNSLFRYDEDDGELLEMRFIDFQIARYGSPTLDLQYFLYTSVEAGVREEHWRELLTTYADELRATLTALGHAQEAVTVDALEEDMRSRASFGLVSACTVLSAVVADPSDAINLDDFTLEELEKGDAKVFEKVVAGKRFHHALQRLLPVFVKNGAL